MEKLKPKELKVAKKAGKDYATRTIVDLEDYNDSYPPDISWQDYHTDIADAFLEGVRWSKENLSKNVNT